MRVSTVRPSVHGVFDSVTGTVTYVVHAGPGSECAIIDPVLDYDPKSGHTSTASAERVVACVQEHDLRVTWILETHAHADHLSAAPWLRKQLGGCVAIGNHITRVQKVFADIFNLGPGFCQDGSQFGRLFAEGERFGIGELEAEVLYVPGHTPACVAYKVGDAVFVGDTLFMPDLGTARCDFPGGDARKLFASARKLLSLPPETRLFMCHDYPPEGREPAWETTVGEQRVKNIHVGDDMDEEAFVAVRTARDATLEMPTLILPSVQVNIRAGEMPPPEDNGVVYLKIPMNRI